MPGRTPRWDWRKRLARFKPRDRGELTLLVGAVVFLLLVLAVIRLAGEVVEGETLNFDKRVLTALRSGTGLDGGDRRELRRCAARQIPRCRSAPPGW